MPRQHATPILIQSLEGPYHLQRLARLRPSNRLGERHFQECLLQELIHAHPDMLPVEELEPSFNGLRPVCRELPLGREDAKYLDNLLVNANGRICLVECKLWRNPEAVRAVVAQVLDYAGELSRLTYEELNSAVRRACRQNSGDVLADQVLGPDATEEDRADFHDAVTRSLQLGNFLLLIVGDGIRAGLQQIAELLQNRATLGFSLALVEMAMYGTDGATGPYYVQPRLLLQTEIVTRTVFIAGQNEEVPRISQVDRGTKPQTLSEQEFYAALAKQDPTYPDTVQALLDRCREIGVAPELKRTFVLYVDLPDGGTMNLGSIRKDGTVEIWVGKPMGRPYVERVATFLGPDATVRTPNSSSAYVSYEGRASIPLRTMLNNQEEWLSTMREAVEGFKAQESA